MKLFLIFLLFSVCFCFCGGATRKPKDAEELQAALKKARAGDVIQLEAKEYVGEFAVTETSPIPESPITIRGQKVSSDITTLSNPNGTVFKVTADNVIFRTMWIVNSGTGMVLTGSGNELDGLTVKDSKEGIVVTGEKNKLQALTFSNVDVGLLVQANHLTLQHSSITSGNISLQVDKETCCNLFDNNVFNGYVNLLGNGNKLKANVANGGMLVTGCYNEFESNVIQQMKLTKKCDNPDKGLNVFNKSPDQNFE